MPGFTAEQATSLAAMITTTVSQAMKQVLTDFTNQQQHQPEEHTPDDDVELPNLSQLTVKDDKLKAEDVGFFDPQYEPGNNAPVLNAGKHVYYQDVYVFVDRLKDVADIKPNTYAALKNLIPACLRGSALIWYSVELTELEKKLLRNTASDLQQWYTTLIDRFKIRTLVAMAKIATLIYTPQDIRKGTHPRVFIQNMLHLAKSANITLTHSQLLTVWNAFHMNIRRDIPEPKVTTTLNQFLEDVDSKVSI